MRKVQLKRRLDGQLLANLPFDVQGKKVAAPGGILSL
jgi:hypothetical protein